MAISLAGRRRGSITALRDAVGRLAGAEDRVVRSAVAVTVVREHPPEADPRAEAERLRSLAGEAIADAEVSAGVAGPKPGASGAHFALVQAEHALALGRGLHGDGHTTHFDDLGSFCFVLNQPANDVRALSARLLGPLADDSRHDHLFDTLDAYLRSSGNVNEVARQLYVHRNTVRHRMRRIQKLIQADLDDPDTRLGLQLAVLGRRALARIAM